MLGQTTLRHEPCSLDLVVFCSMLQLLVSSQEPRRHKSVRGLTLVITRPLSPLREQCSSGAASKALRVPRPSRVGDICDLTCCHRELHLRAALAVLWILQGCEWFAQEQYLQQGDRRKTDVTQRPNSN